MNLNLGSESSTWLAATASGGPVRRHLRMAQRALLLREGSLLPFRVGMRTAHLSIGEKRLSKHLRLHHRPHPAVTTLLSARWFGIRLFAVNGLSADACAEPVSRVAAQGAGLRSAGGAHF